MKKRGIILILLSFFFFFLIIPISTLLFQGINLDNLDSNFILKFKSALCNSVSIALIVTLISTILAYVVASLIVANHSKRKNIIILFLTIPMLVPTFTHAIGFISLWGNNGLINNLFHTNINIYGFWGIVLCSISYGFPTALIMFVDILGRENHIPYQVAKTLGIPRIYQFIKIRLPYLVKPSLFIMFTVFTMIITDYGIQAMIGGHTITLTSFLYEQIVGKLNFGNGSLISLVLLFPAVIMFIVGLTTKSYGKSEFQREKEVTSSKINRSLALFVYIIVFLLISFPMISCLFISFVKKFPIDFSFSLIHVTRVFQEGYLKYFFNSLVMASLTSIIGTIIAFVTSYIVVRINNKTLSKILHLLTIFISAIPGLVLAVCYMITFNKSFIYGTMIILIIINVIRYLGVPYLTFVNNFEKIDKSVEKSSSTLGIPTGYVIKDVIIPRSLSAIIEGFCYIFVNTMATVTTVLFLATPFNKPLALTIVQLESHNFLEMATFVSLIILITNILLKTVISFFEKKQLVN